MPPVSFALLFNHNEGHMYFGSSRYWSSNENNSSGQEDYIRASIEIDSATASAITLSKRVWEKNNPFPTAYLDNTGHGENRGLVTRAGYCDFFQLKDLHDFTQSELIIRISAGSQKEEKHHDLSNPNRQHYSIQASRQFFPTDWRKLRIPKTTPIIEKVNYSLRWLEGEFDNWSNPERWGRPQNEDPELKVFNQNRTTYAVAYPAKVTQRSSTLEENPDNIIKIINLVGRKNRLLPLSPEISQFKPPFDYANALLERTLFDADQKRIPMIGYYEVHSALAEIGLPNLDSPRRMKPEQGVEFLFTQVLPAMERFISYTTKK